MKEIVFVFAGLLILSSCATSKVQEKTDAKASADEKKYARREDIRQAVETRRFLIKFDRLYMARGQRIDLIPKANYIILDGDRATINAAYMGRQYSFRPISGINMTGKVVSFELKDKVDKGIYQINLKVSNDQNTFNVYLTIGANGNCDASLANYRIDRVRYTGDFVPMRQRNVNEDKDKPGTSDEKSPDVDAMSL
jgi:hypothetical protein